MNFSRTILLCAVMLITGCDVVLVDAPFGTPADADTQRSIEGNWIDESGMVLRVASDARNGMILTQWEDDKHAFSAENHPISVRTVGDRIFLFLYSKDDKESFLQFVWLTKIEKDAIYVRTPKPEAFRKAVESGQLPGKVVARKKNYTVSLVTGPELVKRVSDENASTLFEPANKQPLKRTTLGKR